MMRCMRRMAVSGVGMMRGLLVVAAVVMLGCFPMVMRRVVVVLRRGAVMIGALVSWHDSVPLLLWSKAAKGGARP
jgi:hypothetical protein